MRALESIYIKNFKSIRDQELVFGPLNVLIGGNGSGKSNLVQAFRFLREISQQNLSRFSLERGADSLLHFGRKVSTEIVIRVAFGDDDVCNEYEVCLVPTDEGSLIIDSETVGFRRKKEFERPTRTKIARGAKESALPAAKGPVADYARKYLDTYELYHFHDTSDFSPVKSACALHDNRFLRHDASNLAAYLYFLEQRHPGHFGVIQDTVRQIAPFFEKFVLQPDRLSPDKIRLAWKEKGSDSFLTASSLSDGTLRFICLATLLLQPALPELILLDEPELGLHPAAINLAAGLLLSASARTHIIVATQSVNLVNQFEPENIWTVDRDDGPSQFRRLDKGKLALWLDEFGGYDGYGLGELWEKNILGARP